MTKLQAIELLLARMNSLRPQGGVMFGAGDGSIGNINILARDMNAALHTWRKNGDTVGLQQMAGTLRVMGTLAELEYEQVLRTLDVGK